MNRLLASALIAVCISAQACASATATPTPLPLPPVTVTSNVPTEYIPRSLPVTPTVEGCAYMWGSQDMPALSQQFNARLMKLGDAVTGVAYAYGENCVYANGFESFSAKETDFRVGVKVETIRDEGTMGEWISKVMTVVLKLPADQLQGPQSGRVDFAFKEPDPQELFVTVPIDKYRSQAGNLHGAALLHLFYPNP